MNKELDAEKKGLVAELRSLEVKQRIAQTQEIAAVQILDEQIQALREKIARVEFELSSLLLKPASSGTWVSPDIEKTKGTYLRRGQQIGIVAGLDEVVLRRQLGLGSLGLEMHDLVEQPLLDPRDERLGDPELDIGFEERGAHLAQRRAEVFLGQSGLALKLQPGVFESALENVEHALLLSRWEVGLTGPSSVRAPWASV